MELNAASRAKRSPSVRPTAGGGRLPKSTPGMPQIQRDRVTLSTQVLHILEEQNRRMQEETETSSGEKKVDNLEKSLRILRNCQKIAARIMAGDKVPEEDLRYLMVKDPAGYRLAMAMRKPKHDPEEWESVLTEEDRATLEEEGPIEMSSKTPI